MKMMRLEDRDVIRESFRKSAAASGASWRGFRWNISKTAGNFFFRAPDSTNDRRLQISLLILLFITAVRSPRRLARCEVSQLNYKRATRTFSRCKFRRMSFLIELSISRRNCSSCRLEPLAIALSCFDL